MFDKSAFGGPDVFNATDSEGRFLISTAALNQIARSQELTGIRLIMEQVILSVRLTSSVEYNGSKNF